MVAPLDVQAGGFRLQPEPDIREQIVLAQEFRSLLRAHRTSHARAGQGGEQGGALGLRFCGINAEFLVRGDLHQRAQIMQATDRGDAGETRQNRCGKRRIAADHARHQMTAGGMPGEPDRADTMLRRRLDGLADLAGDLGDAHIRCQCVGGHGDRPSRGHGTLGQM